ncbi:hypothetical protein [Streptomyces sp. NRRL WC-3742]|uniref:hypothetical protein n=1 Tax=Streptomyces sp. NRRL WC-3742 TaxID=1463934 RepID=UPI0004CC697D|nr:hypothetical protein [Streptomyces sp. NRRL WC-3742]
MTERADTTWIGAAKGPTHTGSGPQNIYNSYLAEGAEPSFRRGGKPVEVALDQRRFLRARFIGPRGYGEAAARLERPGTVVLLMGGSGSGRRSAAIVLLHCADQEGRRFRELFPNDERFDSGEPEKSERVLFDLTETSESEFLEAQGRLRRIWEQIRRVGGRLVVVVPQEHEHLLQSDFRQLLVGIGRPDWAGVIVRHLRLGGVKVSRREVHGSAFSEDLKRYRMRELQRLCELMVVAHTEGGQFDAWAAKAVEAVRKRGEEAAQQISSLTDGRQRALLFAAAMLEGTSVDAVCRLVDRLLAKLGHPADGRPELDRDDMTRRLKAVRVDMRGERIHFEALAYGAAVRSHFWLYYPDLRETFGAWVADTVQKTNWLTPADRRRLVGRFTEQALKVGDVRKLIETVESWAEQPGSSDEAVQVLGLGLMSERHGAEFRAKIYDWATSPQPADTLVPVLVRTCVDIMALQHPDQAIVRLHQLARRESGRIATNALLRLARGEKRLYLKLLERVRAGMARQDPWLPDVDLFLALMDPLPTWLPRAEAVRGWREVLRLPPSLWARGVKTWLQAARLVPDDGLRLMGVLLAAAEGRSEPLSHYYLLAHAWETERDDRPLSVSRAEVAKRFRREIDRAQGLGPLVGAAERGRR